MFWGLLLFFMEIAEDGMEYYIECLIEIAVFAAIWIVVSVIVIIAISWTHKW